VAYTLEDVGLLQAVSLFAGVPREELSLLVSQLMRRSYRRNDVIFHRGDPGSTLYIVQEGQVKISLPAIDGDEVTLQIFGRGEFFGEMSLLDDLPRSATATAIEPTRALSLGREQFLAAMQRERAIAATVMAALGLRVRHANDMIEDIVTLDIPARLAKKLLELASTNGVQTPQGVEVGLRLTQQDVASMIGATRESTNKVLRAFILKGWISVEAHRIMLHRVDELQRRIY